MSNRIQACLVALLLVLTAACSTHPRRVDCEGHLRAINAPTPMKGSGVVQP
jgi:hypothetical protein